MEAPMEVPLAIILNEKENVVTPQLSPRFAEKISPVVEHVEVAITTADDDDSNGPVMPGLLCPRNTIVDSIDLVPPAVTSIWNMETLMESPSRAMAKIYDSLLSPRMAGTGSAVMDIMALLSPGSVVDAPIEVGEVKEDNLSPSPPPVEVRPYEIPTTENDLVTSFVSDDEAIAADEITRAIIGEILHDMLPVSNDLVPGVHDEEEEPPIAIPVLEPDTPVETAPRADIPDLMDPPVIEQPELYASLLKPPQAAIDFNAVAEAIVPTVDEPPVATGGSTSGISSPRQKKKCFCCF